MFGDSGEESSSGVSSNENSRPVSPRQRIVALDALRGIALLGILPMNIQAFSMIGGAYLNPTAYGDLQGANYWVWFLIHLLADQKFLTIFSMLFGAGIWLMSSRLETLGKVAAKIHYRRMSWLILFGLLHGYLLWYGDILLTYGLCGSLAFLLRNLSIRRLIILGLSLIAIPTVISVCLGLSLPHWPPQKLAAFAHEVWRPTDAMVADEVSAYRSGWLGEMPRRFHDNTTLQVQVFLLMSFWKVEGLMLAGIALFRMGILSALRPAKLYWIFVALACLIGFPLICYGTQRDFAVGWNLQQSLFFYFQYNYWASILVSLGWIGIVMIVCQSGKAYLLKPAVAVGRMAFTNYLLDSVICTYIFYGFGLGFYGKVNRVHQLELVIAIWVIQVIISPIWLKYFRFGPMEWLWRSLTYWRLQPVQRHPAA